MHHLSRFHSRQCLQRATKFQDLRMYPKRIAGMKCQRITKPDLFHQSLLLVQMHKCKLKCGEVCTRQQLSTTSIYQVEQIVQYLKPKGSP